MGDPRLLGKARPVAAFNTAELDALVADMRDTMLNADGAGLAAPQIGIGLQVMIFGVEHNPRYPDAEPVPYTVLINPTIEPIGEETDEMWEGCLSIPDMRGLVRRHSRLHYRGYDAQGTLLDRCVEGFHARVVQHEYDHLQGILFPMRIPDLRFFGFTDALFSAQPAVDEPADNGI
ncbi:MAG: peptide deformylase [Burkholderiales bacterium]